MTGKLFIGAAQKDLQLTRPTYVFVPDGLIDQQGKLDLVAYQAQRWDSINAGANKFGVGSHIFPDMTQEISPETPEAKTFLGEVQRLKHKSKGKSSKTKLPGRAGQEPEMM